MSFNIGDRVQVIPRGEYQRTYEDIVGVVESSDKRYTMVRPDAEILSSAKWRGSGKVWHFATDVWTLELIDNAKIYIKEDWS